MAIDPPYRLDPFRNIVNVHWEEDEEAPWEEGESTYETHIYYGAYEENYETGAFSTWMSWAYYFPGTAPEDQTIGPYTNIYQIHKNFSGGDVESSGKTVTLTLTMEGSTSTYEFDLSTLMPNITSSGSYTSGDYQIEWKYEKTFNGDPYLNWQSLGTRAGQWDEYIPIKVTLYTRQTYIGP